VFVPGFRLDLMKKDVNLALDSARALSVPLMLTSTVGQIFAAASAAGKGDEDFSAAAEFLARVAQVRLNEPSLAAGGTQWAAWGGTSCPEL
jgi:2-hydroxy-3-oxopropionate reductase